MEAVSTFLRHLPLPPESWGGYLGFFGPSLASSGTKKNQSAYLGQKVLPGVPLFMADPGQTLAHDLDSIPQLPVLC